MGEVHSVSPEASAQKATSTADERLAAARKRITITDAQQAGTSHAKQQMSINALDKALEGIEKAFHDVLAEKDVRASLGEAELAKQLLVKAIEHAGNDEEDGEEDGEKQEHFDAVEVSFMDR